MTAVTAQTKEKPAIRRPETGWARARRLRRVLAAPRTCQPAVAAPGARSGPDWNIVRGDD